MKANKGHTVIGENYNGTRPAMVGRSVFTTGTTPACTNILLTYAP
jgi:hypothetical protein